MISNIDSFNISVQHKAFTKTKSGRNILSNRDNKFIFRPYTPPRGVKRLSSVMQKELIAYKEEPGKDENDNELRLNKFDEGFGIGFKLLNSDLSSDSSEENSDDQELNKFIEGTEVLARWSDGLFYLGILLEVNEKEKKCFIKFEDGSEFWTLFQHIQKAQMQGSEILCAICNCGESVPPNEIVLCDHCGLGYHQQCHNPEIGEDVLQPEVMWNCRSCVFATTAKKGGATKEGPNAEAMQEMKKALPYDVSIALIRFRMNFDLKKYVLIVLSVLLQLNGLNWDQSHKTNKQQCYCYCGGPGDLLIAGGMSRCCNAVGVNNGFTKVSCHAHLIEEIHNCMCKQILELLYSYLTACIQCLEMPMLYGDRFYVFVCSVCNSGPEYLKRLDLNWTDVAHLVIFNLTILHNRKYHEFSSAIVPFVNGNWELLQIPKLYQKGSPSERTKKLLRAFQENEARFKCGREVKKKMSLWSLRQKVPPPVPVIEVSATGRIIDFIVNGAVKSKKKKIKLKGPRTKSKHSEETSSTSTTPEKTGVAVQTRNTVPDSPIAAKFKAKSENKQLLLPQPPTSNKQTDPSPKKKRGRPCGSKNKKGTKADALLLKHKVTTKQVIVKKNVCRSIFNDSTDDDNSSRGTLESIIPPPNDFNGSNNPFCNYLLSRPKNKMSSFNRIRPAKRKLSRNDLHIHNGVIRVKRSCTRGTKSYKVSSEATRSNGTSEASLDMWPSEQDGSASVNMSFVSEGVQTTDFNLDDLRSSVNSYFGASTRIANGETFTVLAKRVSVEGKIEYLIQWDNSVA
ncbi:Metal-response element-binding transcription factor 2 [Nymphon striatum]|nr:Metal-response element-binding transcription factor 2 [Nymphon striatum]